MSRFRRICVASLFAATGSFDVMIHQKIGRMAKQIIKDDPDSFKKSLERRIRHMLGNEDLDGATAYGHLHYNVRIPSTVELHLQPMRPDGSCTLGTARKLPKNQMDEYRPCNNGDDNHCLLAAMHFFFYRFAHHELLDYQSHIFTPPKNKIPELKKITHLDMEDSSVLKWLLTLVADLHQPLHFGNIGDREGKDIKVDHEGRVVNLWEFWEKDLPDSFQDSQNLEKVEHVPTSPDTFFSEWASESQQLACDIYASLEITPQSPKGKTYTITPELHEKWRKIMVTQLQRAAERTAMLLVNILEHKKMHEREKEGRPIFVHQDRHRSNLFTNLMIAAAFLPCFFLFVHLLDRYTTKQTGRHSV